MAPRIFAADDDERFRLMFARPFAWPKSAAHLIPTLLRILARDPGSMGIFYESWTDSFYGGRIDHTLKELVRVRMAELRGCHY